MITSVELEPAGAEVNVIVGAGEPHAVVGMVHVTEVYVPGGAHAGGILKVQSYTEQAFKPIFPCALYTNPPDNGPGNVTVEPALTVVGPEEAIVHVE